MPITQCIPQASTSQQLDSIPSPPRKKQLLTSRTISFSPKSRSGRGISTRENFLLNKIKRFKTNPPEKVKNFAAVKTKTTKKDSKSYKCLSEFENALFYHNR